MGESGKWGRQIQLLRFDRRIKITSMGWFGFFVLCLIGILHAEIVEWTAEGAVTRAEGTFGEGGIALDDEVSMTFFYNDDAGFVVTAMNFLQEDRAYYEEVNLGIKVVIGERIWEGSVENGVEGIPQTLLARFGQVPERMNLELREVESAEFVSFPLSDGGGIDILGMEIRGSNALLGDGIDVASINLDQISSATGSIMTGGVELRFSLDLASIAVGIQGGGPTGPEALELGIEVVDSDVAPIILVWQSSLGVKYLVEQSISLKDDDWSPIEAIDGTGDVIDYPLTQSPGPRFYRLVIPEVQR